MLWQIQIRAVAIVGPRNDVTLKDNNVVGLLNLYGPGRKNTLTPDMMRQMMNGDFKGRALFNTNQETLSLRNDHLSRVTLDDKFIDSLMYVFRPANGDSPATEIDSVALTGLTTPHKQPSEKIANANFTVTDL